MNVLRIGEPLIVFPRKSITFREPAKAQAFETPGSSFGPKVAARKGYRVLALLHFFTPEFPSAAP